jgi:signal transduction histidine kinase/nitroreductase
VPAEVVERLVEAAHWAPFGTRGEERHFLVLGGERRREFVAFLEQRLEELRPALEEASPEQVISLARSVLPAISSAPVLLLVYAEVGESGPLLSLGSIGAAVENLLLAAHAEGLGACWLTGATYLADDISQFVGPAGMQLVGLVPLGYPLSVPAEAPPRPRRLYWRGFPDRPEEPLPTWRIEPLEALPRESARARLFLVDDNPEAREFLSAVLEQAGYEVVRCATAQEALARLEEQVPDLIVADALLPGMTGYQLAKHLRERHEGLLPILLTTTSYTTQDESYALKAGADALVDKPTRPQTLLAHVDSLLRAKRLYDQVQEGERKLEQANHNLRRLQEEQTSLTQLIVHDLRTPLTSVLGALDLVLRNPEDTDLRDEMLPMAQNAGQAMLGLINDLLDVAKMESSTPDLDLGPVSLGEIMAQVEDLTAGAARDRGLKLEMAPPDPPVVVRADADYLRRALTNLVGNALKFTFQGGVRVWAEADAESGFAALRVQDTGPGIPPQALSRIFEKFGQVERPEGMPRMGTGLGLTFVKMAAEALGGRVEVESELDRGSTFTLYLPLAVSP